MTFNDGSILAFAAGLAGVLSAIARHWLNDF